MKDERVSYEQELGKDRVVAMNEAWGIVEADQARLDDLQRALCYDQDEEDGETWQTTDDPVEDRHVCYAAGNLEYCWVGYTS